MNILSGRYRLDRSLGQGATAEVFEATDLVLDRAVAVKVFHPQSDELNSLVRRQTEMRSLAALSSPYLVTIHDAHLAESDDEAASANPSYLVMELVAGRPLSQLMDQDELTEAEIRTVGAAVAEALAAVHQLGYVHRDVKPANILVTDSGAVKLGDFGLVRRVVSDPLETKEIAVVGTVAYLSPEQAVGANTGPESDIYSLGLVLLECLTGHQEFAGDIMPATLARLLRDPVLPEDLPEPWPDLLRRMTAADRRERPEATEVAAILGAEGTAEASADWPWPAAGPVLVGASMAPSLRPRRRSRSTRATIAALALGGAGLVAAVVLVALSPHDAPSSTATGAVSALRSAAIADSTASAAGPSPLARTTAGAPVPGGQPGNSGTGSGRVAVELPSNRGTPAGTAPAAAIVRLAGPGQSAAPPTTSKGHLGQSASGPTGPATAGAHGASSSPHASTGGGGSTPAHSSARGNQSTQHVTHVSPAAPGSSAATKSSNSRASTPAGTSGSAAAPRVKPAGQGSSVAVASAGPPAEATTRAASTPPGHAAAPNAKTNKGTGNGKGHQKQGPKK